MTWAFAWLLISNKMGGGRKAVSKTGPTAR